MFCLIGVNCFFFLWKLTAVTSFSSIVRSVIIFRYCNMHCKFRSVGQLHLKSVVCMMKCSPSLVSRSPFISLFKTQKRETVTSYMSPECYILRTSPPSLLSAPESHIVNVVLSYFLSVRGSAEPLLTLSGFLPLILHLYFWQPHTAPLSLLFQTWSFEFQIIEKTTCNMWTTQLLKVWQIFGWSQIHLFDQTYFSFSLKYVFCFG